jgi:hypothetical protein
MGFLFYGGRDMIDNLLTRLDMWLDSLPAHLVGLSAVGFFVFGLWTLGHVLGVL